MARECFKFIIRFLSFFIELRTRTTEIFVRSQTIFLFCGIQSVFYSDLKAIIFLQNFDF